MIDTRSRFTTLLVVGALLIAGVTGGLAAYDSETTTTTTTSDVSGATNTYTFEPGNSSKTLYVETDGVTDSKADLELRITVAQKGVDYTAYTNASPNTQNATNGHYSWTITHAELEDLPRDEDGGTYNVTVYNTSSGTELENTEVTFDTTGTANSGAEIAVAAASNSSPKDASMTHEVADKLEITGEGAGPFGAETFFGTKNVSTWSGYTKVNGSSSDVEVHMTDADAAETYNSAAEDYDDGDWIHQATVYANGIPLKVYKNEAPDGLGSDVPHAVYNTNTETLEVNLAGDDYVDVSTLQLRGGAGEGYGFGELSSNFGTLDALSTWLPNL